MPSGRNEHLRLMIIRHSFQRSLATCLEVSNNVSLWLSFESLAWVGAYFSRVGLRKRASFSACLQPHLTSPLTAVSHHYHYQLYQVHHPVSSPLPRTPVGVERGFSVDTIPGCVHWGQSATHPSYHSLPYMFMPLACKVRTDV